MSGPDWTTAEIDAAIVSARLKNPPSSLTEIERMIRARFRITITKGMVTRRCRALRLPTLASPIIIKGDGPPLTPWGGAIPTWRSAEADRLFAGDVARGCRRLLLAARFGVEITTVERRIKQLRGDGTIPPKGRPMISADLKREIEAAKAEAPTQALFRPPVKEIAAFAGMKHARPVLIAYPKPPLIAKKEPPVKPPNPVTAPDTRGTSSPKGGTSAVFTISGWNMATLPKLPPRKPGVCAWPLECGEKAEGRYCAHHAGLRKKGVA